MSEDWKALQVGDFCEVSAGGTPDTSIKEYWEDGNIPWMSSGEVHKQRIKETESHITTLGLHNSSAKFFPKDSVLVALAGQGKTRGKVAISEIELTTNQSIAAIIARKGICDPEFLYYNLSSRYEELRSLSGGSGRAGLNLSILSAIEIHLPPLPEQKKIAEILSGIDKAIGIYEEQAKVLANMLDALMQEEIVMNTSTKWIKVGDACTAQAGGTPDRSQKGYYEGRIPWVKSGEVKGEDIFQTDESISNEAISNSSAKIVQSGSVLVAMYGATAGQTARLMIDAATNQAVLSLNSKTIELSNDYLYHSVTAFKNQLLLTCQGSGQPNLSSGLIKELEIPLPDQLVQQKISSALDSVRHRTLALRGKINSSKSLKNSIASDLLSGRKRVSV